MHQDNTLIAFRAGGGDEGMIMLLDGDQWTRIESNTQEFLTAIWGTSEDNMVAVGDNGLILHFNGDDWQEVG